MANERTDIWQSPLCGRYASNEMKNIFSEDRKFTTWHKLWVALAKAEHQLGLGITEEQIKELEQHQNEVDYETARAREKEVRHDVMSHVYAYGKQCPTAAGIIHLGATSCYVTDNTDILNIKDALLLVKKGVLGVAKLLADFAQENKDLPTLGFTHGQPATPVTVGKRATLWLQNFMENLDELDFVLNNIKMLGCRGATGTQETFMQLFEGDQDKVKQLDRLIAKMIGINDIYPVSGQTYPRNFDVRVLNCLCSIAVSAYKMAEDIRLLQHDKEIEEPFEKSQIGSSAMAYKRNPMRSERICSLARYVESLSSNAVNTANTQWLERTLDDSANRRMSISESFLATDAVLILCANVVDGLVVNKPIIKRHLEMEAPFMATENIIMEAVKRGGDRQVCHEKIRQYSMEAGRLIKQEGLLENTLLKMVAKDPYFNLTYAELLQLTDAKKLVGRCPEQVAEYLVDVRAVLNKPANKKLLAKGINSTVNV